MNLKQIEHIAVFAGSHPPQAENCQKLEEESHIVAMTGTGLMMPAVKEAIWGGMA